MADAEFSGTITLQPGVVDATIGTENNVTGLIEVGSGSFSAELKRRTTLQGTLVLGRGSVEGGFMRPIEATVMADIGPGSFEAELKRIVTLDGMLEVGSGSFYSVLLQKGELGDIRPSLTDQLKIRVGITDQLKLRPRLED